MTREVALVASPSCDVRDPDGGIERGGAARPGHDRFIHFPGPVHASSIERDLFELLGPRR